MKIGETEEGTLVSMVVEDCSSDNGRQADLGSGDLSCPDRPMSFDIVFGLFFVLFLFLGFISLASGLRLAMALSVVGMFCSFGIAVWVVEEPQD